MKTNRSLKELYSFPGFRALARFKSGVFQEPKARVVELVRRQKKRCVHAAGRAAEATTTRRRTACEMWTLVERRSIWNSNTAGLIAESARA